jgi:hypothetical protein
MPAIVNLDELLRSLEPVLNPGTYVFATLPADASVHPSQLVACIHEPEGLSVVLKRDVARLAGITPLIACAWITLNVHSDLQAVGLTAAFASALGRAGISCNVVAGASHDHIFVPEHQAEKAMVELKLLQAGRAPSHGASSSDDPHAAPAG